MAQDVKDPILSGLNSAEAESRLRSEGYNELPASRRRTLPALVASVLREPMFIMLIACGLVYLLLGSIEDAMMLLGSMLLMIAIAIIQEGRAERALDALRDLSSPRALVIRDGVQLRIPGREVARGDIILVSEGDRVPADALLLTCSGLTTDESLLTGESLPVRKSCSSGDPPPAVPGGDGLPYIFSGSLVVGGRGIAEVSATGASSEIGRIGKTLGTLRAEPSILQRQVGRMIRIVGLLSGLLCIVVALSYGLLRGNWLNGLLAGLTMAMATIPEEFPMVLMLFLALGAWRLSRYRVLTRRMPAIETLGAASVLCVDKTGTITENRMSVRRIYADGIMHEVGRTADNLPQAVREVVEYAILASPPDPFDPMERAMLELGELALGGTGHLRHKLILEKEYPLSEGMLAISHAWRSTDGEGYVIAAKGAPETIADLCHFDAARMEMLQGAIDSIAADGMRLIGVARAAFGAGTLPEERHDYDFSFVGLLGLEDPVRPGVPEALEECRTAGVRVIMITGDYPATARRIGEQIGLGGLEQTATGAQLEAMGRGELQEAIGRCSIFARMRPGQKLGIVEALKATGSVVAMTGDGVNDAPALKAAHIGIAMGGRGSDVAREAAAIVLVDDHFGSIVRGIRMGRRIYDNIRKAVLFILAVHIPIAGISLLPVLLGWPLALLPAHVLFLEFLIDPSCSIVFEVEREEADVMKRPPRKLDEPLVGSAHLRMALLQGAGLLLAIFGTYLFMLMNGYAAGEARMVAFGGIVAGNLGLISANRSFKGSKSRLPNAAQWWVGAGALIFFILVAAVPEMRILFRFDAPSWHQLPPAIILTMACLLLPDIVKSLVYRLTEGIS